MRPGKFSESVLKRSVLKQIKTKREEVNRGAEVGEDCAFFSFDKKEATILDYLSGKEFSVSKKDIYFTSEYF